MADKAIHTEIIEHKAIIVCISDKVDEKRPSNNNFFSIKIVDLYDNKCDDNIWSLNSGLDMTIVLSSLITRDFTLLAQGTEHLIAFRNDLLANEIISQEVYDKIDELRENKKPQWVI